MNLGEGTFSLMKPLAFNLFAIRSRGAVNLSDSVTLVSLPFTRLNVTCLNLLMSTDKNLIVSFLVFEILVFSSDSSNFNSSCKKSLTLDSIVLHSSSDPLTPIIQSSAYLTYTNFLKFGSCDNLDFT